VICTPYLHVAMAPTWDERETQVGTDTLQRRCTPTDSREIQTVENEQSNAKDISAEYLLEFYLPKHSRCCF
jgi:hypothetical protein